MVTKQQIDDLNLQADRYLAATGKRRRFEKKHQEVMEELAKLAKVEEQALKLLKASACEHATPGKTVVPLETAEIRVMVIGGHEGVSYDARQARRAWSEEIFDRVVTVDAKKVAALVALGDLDAAAAVKVENVAAPLAPKVKVEVLGK